MSYWNYLRASGINLYERYCVECQTKKTISLFPKHQKYIVPKIKGVMS